MKGNGMEVIRTALVTGGSRGIGAACVRKFAEEGYKTAFLYSKSDEEAEKLKEETGALPVKCDVASRDEVDAAIGFALKELGTKAFDALVCNAGVSVSGLIQDLTDEEWGRISKTNIDGAINAARAAAPGMISEKKGSMVFISSIWGRSGASCEAAYSATKAAVKGLGQALAKELGPSGIRVNIVAPGMILTDMNKGRSKEEIEAFTCDTPLGRAGKPEEVAELVYFLCSDKASYITGQTVGVDGGYII